MDYENIISRKFKKMNLILLLEKIRGGWVSPPAAPTFQLNTITFKNINRRGKYNVM